MVYENDVTREQDKNNLCHVILVNHFKNFSIFKTFLIVSIRYVNLQIMNTGFAATGSDTDMIIITTLRTIIDLHQ